MELFQDHTYNLHTNKSLKRQPNDGVMVETLDQISNYEDVIKNQNNCLGLNVSDVTPLISCNFTIFIIFNYSLELQKKNLSYCTIL